jgi:hypothetical protein
MQKIIDKIRSKKDEHYLCECLCRRCLVESPVYIGDVLERIAKKMPRNYSGECSVYVDTVMKLVGMWESCSLSKSLQEIAEESGYECLCCQEEVIQNECDCKKDCKKRLKSPQARALQEFIESLIFNQ